MRSYWSSAASAAFWSCCPALVQAVMSGAEKRKRPSAGQHDQKAALAALDQYDRMRIHRDQALRQGPRTRALAFAQSQEESAARQVGIVRILFQRTLEILGSGVVGVLLLGEAAGKITTEGALRRDRISGDRRCRPGRGGTLRRRLP